MTIATAGVTAESGSDAVGWSYSFVVEGDVPFADLTAAPHVIAVDIVEDDLVSTVACGKLTGEVVGNRLVIGLEATETGGLAGVAVVTDRGDDSLAIEGYVILAADGSPLQPGEATDADPDIDLVNDTIDEDDGGDDEQVSDDGV
jgi:hypothetical protein